MNRRSVKLIELNDERVPVEDERGERPLDICSRLRRSGPCSWHGRARAVGAQPSEAAQPVLGCVVHLAG